jgi:CxxC-x17-CxxC domain-containing protein
MKNFEPGGLRKRRPDLGGRPAADIENYAPNKRRPGYDARAFRGRPQPGRLSRTEGASEKPELFKTTCTNCGKPCEVPFKPDGIKPVLCRDCFATKNASANQQTNSNKPNHGAERGTRLSQPDINNLIPSPTSAKSNHDYNELKKQITVLETKLNRIVDLLTPVSEAAELKSVSAVTNVSDGVIKKTRKPKLLSPAVKKAAVKKKVAKKDKLAKKIVKESNG